MGPADERRSLRIGELSRRLGVTAHVLRAWETRYGLLRPSRSNGGYRLYSEADADRIRRMQQHLAAGLSAAEAAQAVLAEAVDGSDRVIGAAETVEVGELPSKLREALDAFDEPSAQQVMDRLLS